LQLLGLHIPIKNRINILNTLIELHNAQSFLPIVVTMDRDGGNLTSAHITIFPAFYSVDRRATIPKVLAQSFYEDQGKFIFAVADFVYELSIYLTDSSDMPSICALAKGMAASFPRVIWLNLWFERQCEIVSFLLAVDDYNRI
jgi:hypothetical protein